MPNIQKIYLEPTNHCNLECETCIRNTWTSEFAEMSLEQVQKLSGELKSYISLENVVFAGFGEPLCHPQIIEIVATLSTVGCNVELISNAALLTEEICHNLLNAGLHQLWVSVDGASVSEYERSKSLKV